MACCWLWRYYCADRAGQNPQSVYLLLSVTADDDRIESALAQTIMTFRNRLDQRGFAQTMMEQKNAHDIVVKAQ